MLFFTIKNNNEKKNKNSQVNHTLIDTCIMSKMLVLKNHLTTRSFRL